MTALFDAICTVVFTFEDNSTIAYRTTLNEKILSQHHLAEYDGLYDLDSNTLIPMELFDYPFSILDSDYKQSQFDAFFNTWSKVGWEV